MQLFNIGGVDFTNRITVPSYTVNSQDIYKEWTDNNMNTHRHVYRQKISGQFSLHFTDVDDYFNFLELLKTHKGAGGYTPVSLYVNNLNTIVTTNVFINTEPSNSIPYMGTSKYVDVEVSVNER